MTDVDDRAIRLIGLVGRLCQTASGIVRGVRRGGRATIACSDKKPRNILDRFLRRR